MNISQTLTLFVTGLICLGLLLFAMQIKFTKTLKNNEDGKLKTSFSIWAGAIFLSSCLMLTKMLTILNDALNIYKNFDSPIISAIKTASIYIGLSSIWIIILIFIINILSNFIFDDRNEKQEMENDNYAYFILKSLMLIGSILTLLPAFESLLKIFLPIIQTPFYH
jgi:hypothetical protein